MIDGYKWQEPIDDARWEMRWRCSGLCRSDGHNDYEDDSGCCPKCGEALERAAALRVKPRHHAWRGRWITAEWKPAPAGGKEGESHAD